MMIRSLIPGLVVLSSLVYGSSQAEASSYHHIDLVAVRIQNNTARLYQEIGLHYQHTPHLVHLLADARDIHGLAQHIHVLAHHHGSLRHIDSDLRRLDRAFHHLEELICAIDHGHHGHIHSAHVRCTLNTIESDIHHLRRDLDCLLSPHHGDHVVVLPLPSPRIIVPAPRQRGVEIRSGWTRTLEDLAGGRRSSSRWHR